MDDLWGIGFAQMYDGSAICTVFLAGAESL